MNSFSAKCILILVCLHFLAIKRGYPQTSLLNFEHITDVDGLSNNSVTCIFQDSNGFIWFGTQNGLNRYDGNDFTNFYHHANEKNCLSNNVITAIQEDNNRQLWIGTLDGLNIYSKLDGSFKKLERMHPVLKKYLDGGISALLIKNNIVWIGTESKGLNRYDPVNKTFTHYPSKYLNNNSITSLIEDSDHSFWIGTNSGLTRMCLNNEGKIESLSFYLKGQIINSVYQDKEQNIWIGTHNGLNLLQNLSPKKAVLDTDFIHFSHKQSDDKSISNNDVKAIYNDDNGNLWIGTRGGGIDKAEMDESAENITFLHYQHIPSNPNSLIQNEVFNILQDNSGILWVGTHNGLSKINNLNPNFYHYQSNPFDDYSIVNNNIAAIESAFINNKEFIFLGSSGGINFKSSHTLHQHDNHFTYVNDSNSDNDDRKIQSLFNYKPGKLWIGTKRRIKIYDYYNHTFLPVPKRLKSLPLATIRNIHRDKTGLIWIGTTQGLFVWNPVNQKLTSSLIIIRPTLNNENINYIEPTQQNNVFAIEEDAEGNIWVGTWGGGLIKYKAGAPYQLPSYYTHHTNQLNSLSSNYVTAIKFSQNGDLWVGTTDGLNLLKNTDAKSDACKFITYKKTNGLRNNHIAGIIEDNRHYIWMSTINSISRINPKNGNIINYRFPFGNITKENYTMGTLKDSKGYLYFGGMSGLLTFHPDSVETKSKSFPVLLTDFQIFNSEDPYKNNRKEILSINNKKVHLTYRDYAFSFSFASLDYAISDQISYAYILEGIDKSWIYRNSKQRYASYSNLNPGKYVLKVKATNAFGTWSPEVTLLNIYIETPYWKTSWAYFLYVVIIILILYKIITYILSRERLENKLKIERLEKEKIKEVDELKLNYFTNISHEFRTPLTLILGPLEQLYKLLLPTNNKPVKDNLSFIQHNVSHLLRLINQLMDFRKAEEGKMKLRVSEGEPFKFIEKIKQSFIPLSSKKSISLDFKSDIAHRPIWCDWDKIEKILNNLIYNAISFTPIQGKILIKLSFTQKSNQEILNITIKDSGNGISKAQLNHIFDVFYQADNQLTTGRSGYGIGLSLTKKLIELHKGAIYVESEPGKGTSFSIQIPVNKNVYQTDELVGNSETEPAIYYSFPDDEVTEMTVHKKNSGPLLLLVDDNSDIRKYIRNCFYDEYQILEAENGTEGLEKAIEHGPDLIISDVMMPEMDGNEFCRKIKLNLTTSHIPIIILTALDSKDHLIEGLETGADVYLTKPFHYDVLKLQAKKLIEGRQMLKKHFAQQAIIQPKEVTVNSVDEEFLLKAMSAVENNISNSEYTIDDFVNEMAMGRSVLYRKLKQLIGQSPNQFIRTVRLKKAAQLLNGNAGNVSEICYEVGFTDPGYFIKCFKKQFGKTPKDFLLDNMA